MIKKYDIYPSGMAATSEHHFTWCDQLQPGTYALLAEDPATETAVIFVHGFLGDAEGTWLNFQEMIDSYRDKYRHWTTCDCFFFAYRSFRQSMSDSAEELLKFVNAVFPAPPTWLFTIPTDVPGVPGSVIDMTLESHVYKRLVLVGHSEGGVVIRRAVVIACKRRDDEHPVLNAKLALFAPALLGFTPSGWIGACLAVGRVEAVAMTVFGLSPAFVEMKDKAFLMQVKEDTSSFLGTSPHLAGLRARVLFGTHEHIVVRQEYTGDWPENPESGKDHVSICKPQTGYERPLEFTLK